jgi:dUTP diphosphatase
MLKVQKLHPDAKVPTVGHLGEDLAYDLYCLDSVHIDSWSVSRIGTGIAAVFDGPPLSVGRGSGSFDWALYPPITKWGLLIQDRSSIANISLFTIGCVIDSGYRGEIKVMLANFTDDPVFIPAGSKVAQMIPTPVLTQYGVIEVAELPASSRKEKGFGSTGK